MPSKVASMAGREIVGEEVPGELQQRLAALGEQVAHLAVELGGRRCRTGP